MGVAGGPNIERNGLVFGYDTGYPIVSGSSDTYRFNLGEPTTNLLTEAEQDPRNWTGRPTADKTLLSETYLGLPVYRLQDADGVDPDVYVDNYQSVATETGLTEGDTYIFSFYFRVIQNNNIADTVANNLAWVWYAGTTDYVFWNDYELNKWHKAEIQATVGSTYSQLIPRIDYDNSIIDICGLQFEKKSYATPYTTGTRSATQSLVDITGNRSIDLSNVSFNSNGQMAFDGTDDYIDLGSDITFKTTGGWTVESVVKYNSVAGGYNNLTSPANFIGAGSASYNSWFWSVLNNKLALWNISPGVWKYGSTTLQADNWYHVILVSYDSGTSYQMYLNGVAEGGDHTTYSWNASYSGLKVRYIGAGQSTRRYTNGELPVNKIYNRALTAQEVQQNYRAYKNRFDF